MFRNLPAQADDGREFIQPIVKGVLREVIFIPGLSTSLTRLSFLSVRSEKLRLSVLAWYNA